MLYILSLRETTKKHTQIKWNNYGIRCQKISTEFKEIGRSLKIYTTYTMRQMSQTHIPLIKFL